MNNIRALGAVSICMAAALVYFIADKVRQESGERANLASTHAEAEKIIADAEASAEKIVADAKLEQAEIRLKRKREWENAKGNLDRNIAVAKANEEITRVTMDRMEELMLIALERDRSGSIREMLESKTVDADHAMLAIERLMSAELLAFGRSSEETLRTWCLCLEKCKLLDATREFMILALVEDELGLQDARHMVACLCAIAKHAEQAGEEVYVQLSRQLSDWDQHLIAPTCFQEAVRIILTPEVKK